MLYSAIQYTIQWIKGLISSLEGGDSIQEMVQRGTLILAAVCVGMFHNMISSVMMSIICVDSL